MNSVYHINIRVYGAGEQVALSHGFIVDDLSAGISNVIGTIAINPELLTIKQLRTLLEYNHEGNATRRSMIFQEALFIMQRLPNIYNKPNEVINKYTLGYAKKNMNEVKLLDCTNDEEVLVNLVKNIYDNDIIIIPLTQVPDDLWRWASVFAIVFISCNV